MTSDTRGFVHALNVLPAVFAAAMCACDAVDESSLPSPALDDRVNTPDVDVLDSGEPPVPTSSSGDCKTGDTCTRPDAVATCEQEQCIVLDCVGAKVDCDKDPDNGCEATLTSMEHCGLCGAACKLPNSITSCDTGSCRWEKCKQGFGDCDGQVENGCETRLDSTNHCGACGNQCPPVDNGVAACLDGQCGAGQCLGRFGDCDEQPTDCETELVSEAHCGACDTPCAPQRGTGACLGGTCVVETCSDGYADCNGLGADGCEADLASAIHCGACGASCSPLRATQAACNQDGAAYLCVVDHRCAEGDDGCVQGAPETGCEAGYADCDGLGANGCETQLDSTSNCGGCGVTCQEPSTIFACDDGACMTVGCEIGFDRCPGDSACRSLAGDPMNCGSCGNECPASAPNCYGGRCTSETCPAGRADCNGMGGCATYLTDSSPASCGLCDLDCRVLPNAVGACAAGLCTINACDPGFADCDGVISNGCETDITTADDCGACGQVCALDGATAACQAGECVVETCNPGRADCNGSPDDGCETDTSLASSCGACGLDCAAGDNVARGGCAMGVCQLTCDDDFGDCDGDATNGCEADFALETSCGSCNTDCSALPRVASAQCGAQGCENLVCDQGYADCDGLADNGCERDITTMSDCGGCDLPCAPPRGTGQCLDGACVLQGCDSGFDDCNGEDADGCEASLASPSSCGDCNTVCEAGRACDNGDCKCTIDDHCPNGQECCGGTCIDTNAVCSLWPCPVLGTARDSLLHCGGCDVFCPDVAAFFCCGPLGQ